MWQREKRLPITELESDSPLGSKTHIYKSRHFMLLFSFPSSTFIHSKVLEWNSTDATSPIKYLTHLTSHVLVAWTVHVGYTFNCEGITAKPQLHKFSFQASGLCSGTGLCADCYPLPSPGTLRAMLGMPWVSRAHSPETRDSTWQILCLCVRFTLVTCRVKSKSINCLINSCYPVEVNTSR